MVERSTVAQVSQIGVETTPGTSVPATRRLGSMSISPSVTNESEPFTPAGLKFPTVLVLNREWADVSLEGTPTYEEVIYPLSGAVGGAVVSQVLDGATPTLAYEWVFTPNTSAADAPKTFTLEQGQAGVQAEKFAHLLFTAFGLDVSRTAVTMTGSGFAQALLAAITPTAGLPIPTDLNPMSPGQFSIYMADTQAALSAAGSSDPTKRLGRVISTNPSVEDRYNPAWFVDASQSSFATWVENPDGVGGQMGMTVEADAAGMANVGVMRAGTTKFVRIESLGPVIYDAGTMLDLRHMFRWDLAVKIVTAEAWADSDGIYGIPFTFQPFHDGTWGKAQQITVRNKVASL